MKIAFIYLSETIQML